MDPDQEVKDKLGLFSQVKQCPKCRELAVTFDAETKALKCSKCDFRQELGKA